VKETEKDSMKTGITTHFRRPIAKPLKAVGSLFVLILMVAFQIFYTVTANAAMSEREYEAFLRGRQKDFERVIKLREEAARRQSTASEALRAARVKDEERKRALEVQYQQKMKRYSMEEVEKRDREDEARLAKEASREDRDRELFVGNREKREALEAKMAINTYQEFDINMAVEPESKSSHTESSQQEK
jgi:hypothetical protein